MAPAFNLHAVAQWSTLRIVDSLAEGVLVTIFAALILRLSRRHAAGTKFAVWFSGLIAIAVIPLLGSSRPIVPSIPAIRPAITLPDSWAMYLCIAWATVAAWLLLGVTRAVWQLRVLRKSCVPVESSSLDPMLQATLRRKQKRSVTLCTSEQVRIPTAIGLWKPAIALPRWVLEELSPTELNHIILHELAHLERWDDWTNLAQQLVKAVFFFHPAVWWIEKKLSLEREIACDDAVLAETASPRAYAECLAHLAERSFVRRSLALAQAALGRLRHTSLRVAQILDVNRPSPARHSWKWAASLVTAFAIVCALSVSRAPKLIAFQDEAPRTANTAVSSIIAAAQKDANEPLGKSGSTAGIVPLRLSTQAKHTSAQAVTLRHAASKPNPVRTVKFVSQTAVPAPLVQTLFVVIERGDGTSAVEMYQLQMWRITALERTIEQRASKIPSKQT